MKRIGRSALFLVLLLAASACVRESFAGRINKSRERGEDDAVQDVGRLLEEGIDEEEMDKIGEGKNVLQEKMDRDQGLEDERILNELKKKASDVAEEGPLGVREGGSPKPAIYFWMTGSELSDDDLELDVDSPTGIDSPTGTDGFEADPETEKLRAMLNDQDEENDNTQWVDQIYGVVGVQGISSTSWNDEKQRFPDALSAAVVNLTKIDKSQLAFKTAKEGEAEKEEEGDDEPSESARFRRQTTSLRLTMQQFSVSYTINLRSDDDGVRSQEIVDAMRDKVLKREFSDSFRKFVQVANPGGSDLDNIPRGAVSFVATAMIKKTPVRKPDPSVAADASAMAGDMFSAVGLDDWSRRENGVVKLRNKVETTIKIVVEGHHATSMGEEQALFKAATLGSLKKLLSMKFEDHLTISLNALGDARPGDWGGSSAMNPEVFEFTIGVADVPTTFDREKLDGAIRTAISSDSLVHQLCELAGKSWCLGAKITAADTEPEMTGTVDLTRPESNRVNGVSGVLYPYFHTQ